ncbi:hypothetical protein CRG98_001211 [Punica granatum]|uniref:Uncharacterized protein n=1 Tax=Punica granatum TaxID=22663 RepID=A0A2I0LCI0_PUNGR|nr:hypothetical protein CRG98_001211 [Punica granatum]
MELEEVRLGPLSKASNSAMLVAIWLTVPSRAAMRAWSLVAAEVGEAGGRGAPEDARCGRCVGRAVGYAGSTPAGVRGGGATVRVDLTTLGTNYHHGHLEGSLGYPRPPTLSQNSIGRLHGDVRPDLCQSSLSSIPAGSVWCHSGLFNGKQPKPDPSTVQPDS